jgi:formylglycine-generating enzyme required for sulfatase activity
MRQVIRVLSLLWVAVGCGDDAGVRATADAAAAVDGPTALDATPASDAAVPAADGAPDATPDAAVDGRGLDPDMVAVPGGPGGMGCDQAVESGLDCNSVSRELPHHVVTLSPFAIDRTEVSQAAWRRCMNAGACPAPTAAWAADPDPETLAATDVTWEMARGYCSWAGKRLPTEAEWERAARGRGQRYPWGAAQPDCDHAPAVDIGCGLARPRIGSRPAGASPYGALDMAGGVAEWVSDWYDAAYYASSPPEDPPGPATGTLRIVRGGSWASEAPELAFRTSFRALSAPDQGLPFIGFRCVRPLP